MSHILIKFLISIFILNISYGIDFNTWTENSKNIIFNSKSIVKISFDAKIIINGTEVLPHRSKKDSYLILDIDNNVYQIQFFFFSLQCSVKLMA